MNIEILLSFITVSIVLTFSPGPIVIMTMGQALAHGKKSVIPLITGVFCGDLLAMILSLVGIGVLLSTSATLFNILRWVGAGYLIFLGIRSILSTSHKDLKAPESFKTIHVFREAFIVSALNPKGILFYTTFFPLFIDASKPIMTQIISLGILFQIISILSVSFYTLLSSFMREKVKSRKFTNLFNKLSGTLLISAGIVTAAIKK